MNDFIPRFSVRQPVLVNLIALSMLVLGASVFVDMTRESLPSVRVGMVAITTAYPGASPSEVEQLVTKPIEEAVEGIEDIDELSGQSVEGLSMIWIRFEPDVDDVAQKLTAVTNAIAGLPDLPADAEQPVVREGKTNFPLIAVAVRGQVHERVLRQVGRNLAEKLEHVANVDKVTPIALRNRVIDVEVQPERLSALHVPLARVTAALQARANNVPAGNVNAGPSAQLVRAMTQVQTAEDVRQVVLMPDARGAAVTVGDVASVREGLEEPKMAAWIDGQPGIVLVVFRRDSADGIDLAGEVRGLLDEERAALPEGVHIDVFGDTSLEVERSLGALYSNALMGLAAVLALMWLFVGVRNATWAAAGIPVALAGGVLVMDLLGVTINTTSLFALMLCLGIVVDDAIILIENIYRHVQEGKTRVEAAIVGAREVFWPVVSSTLTTISAFLPLLLMTGIMGKFFSIIPKVVIAVLSASLIEALLILPSHMAEMGGGKARVDAHHASSLGARIEGLYLRALGFALRWPKSLVLGAYLVCAGLIALAATTKNIVLFHDDDTEIFDVQVHMPIDATRAQTDALMGEVDERLARIRTDDVHMITTVRGYTRTEVFPESGDHVGMATVYMKPAEQRSSPRAGDALVAAASRAFDDLVGPTQLQVVEFRPGPPRAAPVGVRVMGDDRDQLAELAERVEAELRQIDGTRNVASDYTLGKRELRVRVDEQRAAMHGLTAPDVARWLNAAFSEAPVMSTRVGDEEVEVRVHLDAESRSNPERLLLLPLIGSDGAEVALGDMASVEHGRGAASLDRYDRSRAVMVTSRIDDERTTSTEVNQALMARIAPLRAAHPEVRFKFGGEWEQTQESLDSLFSAFGLAALLIFAILASQFRSFVQPLIVMAGIPLALIGVAVGFLASGESIGLIALVGVVGLEGIVVNDSLVLVDFINQRRAEGAPLMEAIVDASRVRLRPIFLTSITTIAGLAPLALGLGGRSPTLAPMAVAMSWGLAFSTGLILILVPCLYLLTERFRQGLRWAARPVTAFLEGSSESSTEHHAE